MKKFTIRLILFFLPIIVIIVFVEYYLRTQTMFTKKRDYAEKNLKNIEVLFLGSSQVGESIYPEFTKKTSINLAGPGQTIPIDYYLLKKYINKMPKLKVVVFEIAPHRLYNDFRMNTRVAYMYSNLYGIRHKVDPYSYKNYSFLFSDFQFYSSIFYKLFISKKQKISNYGKTNTVVDGRFFDLKYDTTKIDKSFVMIHKFNDEKQFLKSVKYIDEVVKICNNKRIKLIFIAPPFYKTYYSKLPIKAKNETNSLLEKYLIEDNIQNFDFSDGSKLKFLNVYDYLDDHHLNYKGGKKFTLFVDSVLKLN